MVLLLLFYNSSKYLSKTFIYFICFQYRIMEGDRIAYAEESGSSLTKQRKVIKILSRERNSLLNDYRVVVSDSHKRKDDEAQARIHFLVEEHEKLNETIKKNKLDIEEIEYQIAKVIYLLIIEDYYRRSVVSTTHLISILD